MKLNKLDTAFLQSGLMCPEGRARIEYVDGGDGAVPGLFVEVRSTSPGQGTWYLRFRPRGSRQTKYQRLGSTLDVGIAEARKHARLPRAEIALGKDPRAEEKAQKATLTFAQFFEQHYLPHVQPRKRSWKRDEELFRLRIKAKFGHLRLADIRRQQLQAFHTELKEEGLAPATCDHHLKLIKRALNLAVEWEMLEKNPASRVPLFNADNRVEHYLDDEQLARLLQVLRTDANRAVCRIALFLLATGARLNEALSATWDQIDRQNRVWRIPARSSKSKKVHSVALNDSALDVLDELATAGSSYRHLFVNERRSKKEEQPYTTIMKVWRRLRVKAGLPHLRIHDLRHQYASFLVNSGRTLVEVQHALGHANPVTSLRYAHLSSKTMQAAADTAAAAIRRATDTTRAEVGSPASETASAAVTSTDREAANAPTAGGDAEAPQRRPEAGPRAA